MWKQLKGQFKKRQLTPQQNDQNRSLTPTKSTNQAKLYDMNLIPKYLRINKPLLSKARRDTIQNKLQLDQQAFKQTQKRLKKNHYFIKFTYNPFIEKQNKISNKTHSEQKLKKPNLSKNKLDQDYGEFQEQINIVQAINIPKNHRLKSYAQKFSRAKTEKSLLSQRLGSNAKKSKIMKPKEIKRQQVTKKMRQISFQEIINMQEKCFYLQNQRDINIFQFMKKIPKRFVKNDILDRNYFNFNNCVEKMQRYKLSVYRDLSRIGRTMCVQSNKVTKSIRTQILQSRQLSVNLNDIKFIDIMNIASGRINSLLAYNIVYQSNQKDDSQVLGLQQSSIFFEENQFNYLVNVNRQMNYKEENQKYLDIKINQYQMKEKERYHKFYCNILKNLQEQNKLYGNKIKDKKLHRQFEILVANDLDYLININRKTIVESEEAEKNIRVNKQKKNRCQRLKIQQLLNSLKYRNQHNRKIKKLLNEK